MSRVSSRSFRVGVNERLLTFALILITNPLRFSFKTSGTEGISTLLFNGIRDGSRFNRSDLLLDIGDWKWNYSHQIVGRSVRPSGPTLTVIITNLPSHLRTS